MNSAGAAVPKAKAKKAQPVFGLVWIPAAGKGQKKTWSKAKMVGLFKSKIAAEEKRTALMSEYECAGRGDILVGPTWEDEIDLVVKKLDNVEAGLFETGATQAHVLLWLPTNGKGRRKTWSAMKCLGAFATKSSAEQQRGEVMEGYDQCGRGDILVGENTDDEVDLVIKPAVIVQA